MRDWAREARQVHLTATLRAFCITMWIIVFIAAGAAIDQIAMLP